MFDDKSELRYNDQVAVKIGQIANDIRLSILRKIKSAGFAITPEQFMIFSILANCDGINQKEICTLTSKDKSSITRLIDKLVKKELVTREPDPNDGRSYNIFLTEKAKLLKHSLMPLVNDSMEQAFIGFSNKELIQLDSYIHRIADNLSKINFDS